MRNWVKMGSRYYTWWKIKNDNYDPNAVFISPGLDENYDSKTIYVIPKIDNSFKLVFEHGLCTNEGTFWSFINDNHKKMIRNYSVIMEHFVVGIYNEDEVK